MDLEAMVTAVQVEGGVDTTTGPVTEQQVKDRLNARYRRMVVRAKWRRGQVSFGVTVADQAEYPVPAEVASLEGLLVGDATYARIGQTELWKLKSSDAYWSGPSGVYAPDFTSSGTEQIELYPAPDEAGVALSGLATMRPVDLTDNAHVPIVPEEFHDAIVEGAIADILARLDERLDLAPYFEQKYDAAVEELRRMKNAQTGGAVSQIRVAGYHL